MSPRIKLDARSDVIFAVVGQQEAIFGEGGGGDEAIYQEGL